MTELAAERAKRPRLCSEGEHDAARYYETLCDEHDKALAAANAREAGR